jgi:hypothetical protein
MNERTRSYQGYKRLSSQNENNKIAKIVTTLHLPLKDTTNSTDNYQRNSYFDKKNSVGANIRKSFMKKGSLATAKTSYYDQPLSNKKPKCAVTPKHNLMKAAKSRVSLLGQYTSCAMVAKSKQYRPNLNRTKPNISYLGKSSNYNKYPLNISTCSNTVHEYKGQTLNVKSMYDVDKRLQSPQPLNINLNPSLKHSLTTKNLNDSIGVKMRSCVLAKDVLYNKKSKVSVMPVNSELNLKVEKLKARRETEIEAFQKTLMHVRTYSVSKITDVPTKIKKSKIVLENMVSVESNST